MGASQSHPSSAGHEGIITVASGAGTGAGGPAPPPLPPHPPTPEDVAAEAAAQALLERLANLRASLPSVDAPAAAVPQPTTSRVGGALSAAFGGSAASSSRPASAAASLPLAAPRDASSTASAIWADLDRARRLTDDTSALSGALAELVGEHRDWVAGHGQALLLNQQHLSRALERCAAKGAAAAQAARAQAGRARASGQALAPAGGLAGVLQALVEQVEDLEGRMEALEVEMGMEEEESGDGGGGSARAPIREHAASATTTITRR